MAAFIMNKIERIKQLVDFKVEGKYEPMDHQWQSAVFMAEHKRCFNLSTMRTGKTGSTLLAYDLLRRTNRARRMLILAPLSTLRAVWYESVLNSLNVSALLLVGTATRMVNAIAAGPDVIVANYEKLNKYYDDLLSWHPDVVCIDECTAYANAGTQRSKRVFNFLRYLPDARVWGLTGTPGHDPIKVFGMVHVVNPENLGNIRSVYQWRELTQYKANMYEWRNRAEADGLMKKVLQPAIRFDARDVLDLPKVTTEAQYAEPTVEIKKAVKALQDCMMAEFHGEIITVQQQSACVGRCLQLLCGCVRAESGGDVRTLTDLPRDQLILDLINSTDRKTVIFSPFLARCHALTEWLNSKGVSCESVTGDTSEAKRAKIFTAFLNEASPRVLVCHPRTTAFGVELSSADLMIFDGVCLSGDFVYGQALARLSSAKQT